LDIVKNRRKTRQVNIGNVRVGGGAPVSIQSMSTYNASEKEEVLGEIRRLSEAGCEVVRVSVKSIEDTTDLSRICNESPLPVVADIHFDYEIAIESVRAGVDGIRINPGNIGGRDKVARVIETAGEKGIPVRVGVNLGSMEREFRELATDYPARAMCESAFKHMKIIEDMGFGDLIFSLKSSDPLVTIEANLMFASETDYPLHLGVTEAGPVLSGTAKSVVALTSMLEKGVGDTIRISLSGDPVREIIAAQTMLGSLGLREKGIEIVSCPTCGRCRIDVSEVAEALERRLIGIKKRVKVAVMGCEVNGPGEARDADIGIAGSRNGAVLFKRGKVVGRIEGDLADKIVEEVAGWGTIELGEGEGSEDK
jgi:(E)-4-hydroxy-3-methylbut-2-enyl-diphosphate synthase